jgi:hypothetical protein
MPASKLTCPDCGKVLRPAKPLPAGKKVKCPECGNVFLAQDDEVEKATIATAVAKRGTKGGKGKDKKAPPPKKPPKADAEKAPAAAPGTIPFADDDDDGPATYAFEQGAAHEEPEIDHVPDTSIKDLRGPAQEAVVRPSNFMIFWAGLGLFLYLFIFAVVFIPIIFPVPEKIDDTTGGAPTTMTLAEKKKLLESGIQVTGSVGLTAMEKSEKQEKKKEKSLFTMYSWDLLDIATYSWWLIALFGVYCIFGIAFCAVVIYGAVRMQTLESRVWGIVSSVLLMLPFASSAIFVVVSILGTLLVGFLFDEDAVFWVMPLWILAGFGPNVGFGIWSLVTLLREDVIAGYEYVEE